MRGTYLTTASLALALAACGGTPDAPLAVTSTLQRPAAAWASAADLDGRTASVMREAAEVWGDTAPSTHGVSVVYTDSLIDCSGVRAVGCTTGAPGDSWLVQVVVTGAPCAEATTLPHEMGHLVLGGDSAHADPRWRDPAFWSVMSAALQGSVPADDAACLAFLDREGAVFAVDHH